MINIITDWMFTNAYTIINIIVVLQIMLLAIAFCEEGQNEIEELVRFKEEKNDRFH